MPRKSSEAKTMSRMVPLVPHKMERPSAPRELNAAQRFEWDTFVNRMPPDWFGPETWSLLTSLCRHICYAREVAGELEEVVMGLDTFEQRLLEENPEIDPDQLATMIEIRLNRRSELARLYDMHTRGIATMATKLRLTPQSKVNPDTIMRKLINEDAKPKTRMPWEDSRDDDDA